MYRLSKFFLINTLLLSLFSTAVIGIFWITNEITNFNKEALIQKDKYIQQKKDYIRNEVLRVIDYVQNRRETVESVTMKTLQDRVTEACNVAEHLVQTYRTEMTQEALEGIIIESLRKARFFNGRGYFFATRFDGIEMLFSDRPEMEGHNMLGMRDTNGQFVIRDMLRIAEDQGEGFYEYTWTKPGSDGNDHRKIAYIKSVPALGWIIGAGEYPEDVEKDIQNEIIEYLSTVRIEDAGYIFGSTYDGIGILGPQQGVDVYDLQDTNGKVIVRELIDAARNGGGFVEYVMPEFEESAPLPKLSYAAPIPEWEWYLGFGLFTYQIDDEIAAGREVLKQGIIKKVVAIVIVMLIVFIVIFLLSRLFSSKLQKDYTVFFQFFKSSVFRNEQIDIKSLQTEEFAEIAVLTNDMVEKKTQTDTALAERLEERSVLIQEIHHRVKNNFQAIVSLFSLQAEGLDDQRFHDFLNEANNRIFSMAAVHNLLYQSDNFKRIDFSEYIEMLIENVFNSMSAGAASVSRILDIQKASLSIDDAVPLGLIMNELLTNSCKYAFAGKQTGCITITVTVNESELRLAYSDNGDGLPDGVGFKKKHGFGFRVINILLEQLHAELELPRGQGFNCIITLPWEQDVKE